jgi:hypothetical protein
VSFIFTRNGTDRSTNASSAQLRGARRTTAPPPLAVAPHYEYQRYQAPETNPPLSGGGGARDGSTPLSPNRQHFTGACDALISAIILIINCSELFLNCGLYLQNRFVSSVVARSQSLSRPNA